MSVTSELGKGSKFSFHFVVKDFIIQAEPKAEKLSGTPRREKEELPPIEEQPEEPDQQLEADSENNSQSQN
jgi:hypothetical protein